MAAALKREKRPAPSGMEYSLFWAIAAFVAFCVGGQYSLDALMSKEFRAC
jgi:hypothetical protein